MSAWWLIIVLALVAVVLMGIISVLRDLEDHYGNETEKDKAND